TADWYASSNWPIDAGDYVLNGGSTASGGAWALPLVGADTDFALANLSNISKTSSTGIRMYVGGGQPTGTNHFSAAALEHTTDPEPRLIVIYNDSAPVIGTPDSPADGAPVPTITPVLKGTATDVDNDPLSFQFQVADDSGFTTN